MSFICLKRKLPCMAQRMARIDIDPKAFRILKALAELEGESPSDYLSALIMREGSKNPEAVEASREQEKEPRAEEREREEAEARWREFKRTKIGD
jgi:hypothetical protein